MLYVEYFDCDRVFVFRKLTPLAFCPTKVCFMILVGYRICVKIAELSPVPRIKYLSNWTTITQGFKLPVYQLYIFHYVKIEKLKLSTISVNIWKPTSYSKERLIMCYRTRRTPRRLDRKNWRPIIYILITQMLSTPSTTWYLLHQIETILSERKQRDLLYNVHSIWTLETDVIQQDSVLGFRVAVFADDTYIIILYCQRFVAKTHRQISTLYAYYQSNWTGRRKWCTLW